MGEEFYAAIKLISGEEIFSLVSVDDNNDNPVLILQNPVTIKITERSMTLHVKIKPWMELSDDDIFIITLDKIITITESKDEKIINLYNNFLSKEFDSIDFYTEGGEVKISDRMGYLSTVKDSRKLLEKLYNLNYDIDNTGREL
jgi:hypothetical protein